MKTALNLALLPLIMRFAGCGERPSGKSGAPPRTFTVRGSLRELPTDGRSAVIRHEEIPGYMPKMTMTFSVKHPASLRGLVPGDEVEFRLVATEDDHWIESLRRVGRGTVPEARPADPAPVQRELVNGDVRAQERTEAISRFTHDPRKRFLIAQPEVLKFGLDLSVASIVIWYSPTDKTETWIQANKRVCGPRQKKPTLVVCIHAHGVEQEVYRRLENHEDMQDVFLCLIENRDKTDD